MKLFVTKASLLLFLCPAAFCLNLDSLLIKTVGGTQALEMLGRINSYRISARINWNNLSGDYTILFKKPDRLKLIADFGSFRIVQTYDGSSAWQEDIHGQVSELTGFEKNELMRNLYFISFAYLPDHDRPMSAYYLGHVIENDRKYHKIAHFLQPDDTVFTLISEQTGRLEQIRFKVDNLLFRTILDDFRRVEGVLLPFHSLESSINGPIRNELVVREVQFDVEIDSLVFAKPETNHIDYHFPPGEDSITVPLIYQNGHVYVKAKINGSKSGWFILDTGASATFYDRSFVGALPYETVGGLPAMGLGGFKDAELIRLDSLKLAELTLYNQTAGVLDLSELAEQSFSGETFGGVLGYDFFAGFPVEIDFQRQILTVFKPETFSLAENFVAIPFKLTIMVPTVSARINGITGEFIVDLGNPYGLIMSREYGEKLGDSVDSQETENARIQLGGIGPAVESRSIGNLRLEIGDIGIEVADVIIADSRDGLAGSRQISGNIGTGILEKFILVFDYPQNRLLLGNIENVPATKE